MSADAPASGAHDRHILLEGPLNFRDLGGYATVDGRLVRWRSLFRADGLSDLSSADRAVLRQLGIATVIDLRTQGEVEVGRFPVEDIPVGFYHLPLVSELPDAEAFRRVPSFFATQYREIARQSGSQIARALSIVAQRDGHPVIVHCAAGKDRTGVLVAIILSLLGVDDDTIAEDYALSTLAMQALRQRMIERNPDQQPFIDTVGDIVFAATPANITSLLAGLRQEHGSIEGYVAAHGAPARMVEDLRAALLD